VPYKNQEDRRNHNRKRYAEDPEFRRKTQAATAAWEATLPDGKWYTPEYGRRKQMERRHKMTVEEYETRLAEQGGHCALCPAVQGDDKRRMAVDHDHECCDKELTCGKCNRGILCADCNRMIGFLEATLKEAMVIPKAGTVKTMGQPKSWTARALDYLAYWRSVRLGPNA
jgi:recombination endonuclease VII